MSFAFAVTFIALLLSFFVAGALLGALFSEPFREKLAAILRIPRARYPLLLRKSTLNPILKPTTHPWTAAAVLNPAAIVLGSRTHLLYRAVGMDGVSRLGYASSPNGIVFDDRPPYPVYAARSPSGMPFARRRFSPMMYPSGGSWGGCEDPRMVAIDGEVYVTFNMFENWKLRVAALAISETDFLAKRFFQWRGPVILSRSRAKNWVLFPEKINGQFAVLHSIIGDDAEHVRIEYADDLADIALREFVSPDPQRVPDTPIAWHIHMRGAGPPPIRTDRGWLVFYHAHDAHEGHRYKLGAMLLDLADPTHILCRAAAPVLVPDEHYENDGKPGVVFACGAVVRNGTLFVYYGGADKVVCVATTTLNTFLDELVGGVQPELNKQSTLTDS